MRDQGPSSFSEILGLLTGASSVMPDPELGPREHLAWAAGALGSVTSVLTGWPPEGSWTAEAEGPGTHRKLHCRPIPTVAGSGARAGPEQSQVAAVAV